VSKGGPKPAPAKDGNGFGTGAAANDDYPEGGPGD
jgi:hypothetical protein